MWKMAVRTTTSTRLNFMKTFPFDKDEPAPGATPTRDQVALSDTWDLTLLYATPAAWQTDFEKLQRTYEQIVQ